MSELFVADNSVSSILSPDRIIGAPHGAVGYVECMSEDTKLRMIGEQLQQAMNERGVTRQDLVTRSGLSYSYISNLLKGHRPATLDSIVKLSRALGLAPVAFLGEESPVDVPEVGRVDTKGLVTMSADLPGILSVESGMSLLGAPPHSSLHCSRADSIDVPGWYLVERRGETLIAAWNGSFLTMGDGERVFYAPDLHRVIGKVEEIRWRPIQPE